jgi:hypothetical protein
MKTSIFRTHLIGFIWLATAIDIWCCQFLTPETELNPLARIIYVNLGLWAMMGFKVFGTWVATEWLRYLPTYFSIIIAFLMAVLLLVLAGVIPIA